MNKKQIISAYNKMLIESKKEDNSPTINCYVCDSCQHITKTIDVDNGVTPMFKKCNNCNGYAKSSFYKDLLPSQSPSEEWYIPSLSQVLKYNRQNKTTLVEHILKGGLCNRVIRNNN